VHIESKLYKYNKIMKSEIIDIENCYVVGDLHGKWPKFNDWLNKKKPQTVFQVGDFGYWPKANNTYDIKILMSSRTIEKQIKWFQCGIKNLNTSIYWCKGNHEDHNSILTMSNPEICDKIYYMRFGSVLTLSDGRNVLFVGGAITHNPGAYQMGLDIFPALEQIKPFEMSDLPDCKIDIVISHTCPQRWMKQMIDYQFVRDVSSEILDRVLIKYQPQLWYFGHFHKYKTGFDSDTDTRWFALNQLSNTGWFKQLI